MKRKIESEISFSQSHLIPYSSPFSSMKRSLKQGTTTTAFFRILIFLGISSIISRDNFRQTFYARTAPTFSIKSDFVIRELLRAAAVINLHALM